MASEEPIVFSKKLTPEETTKVEQDISDLKQEIKENEEVAKKYDKEPIPTAKQQRLEASIKEQIKPTVDAFVEEYSIGEEGGIPVVAPPPGSDVYLRASQFQWYPILQLEEGETYRLHLSSLDVVHGFSLQPVNLNFMVVPDYDYVVTLTPTTSGEFSIVCNEYCLVGHHIMTGKIIVEE